MQGIAMYLSKTGIQAFFQSKAPTPIENRWAAPAERVEQPAQRSGSNSPDEKIQQQSTITGVILAGGKSKRMGRNKALLDMGGM